ncbi:MAG: hypothetical protein AABY43_04065 [Candidatus Omnitrophota bacterium]
MADIALEVLNDNEESSELNEFIEQSLNGTIFHHPKFLSYHGEEKFSKNVYAINHFLFRKKSKIIAFLPGIIYKSEKGLQFNSPYGASFGGFVSNEISFEACDEIMNMTLKYLLSERGMAEINIVPVTSIYHANMVNDYFEFLYLSRGFRLRDSELTIVVRVSQDDDYPLSSYEHRVKKFIKQGERNGINFKICDDIDTAYEIIESNRVRFSKKPTHTLEELKAISRLFPGRLLQFIAFKDELPIAVCCLLLCNDFVAYSFYIDQMGTHSALRPVNFIINQVLIWLKENNYSYLDFGPSTFGLEPHRSLIFFKEGFGGKGIIKHFYQYKIENS